MMFSQPPQNPTARVDTLFGSFVHDDEHYRLQDPHIRGSQYQPGMFDRMVARPLPYRVFSRGFYYRFVDWVAEHTNGLWAFGYDARGYWVIHFDKAADAVLVKLSWPDAVDVPNA